MNAAVDTNGDLVLVGQQGTIHGAVTAVSGSGVNATVTVLTILGDTVTCRAGDIDTPDDQQTAANPGRTNDGNAFATFDPVTINGMVMSVTPGPWGITGTAVVKTDFSGLSVTVFSGTLEVNG